MGKGSENTNVRYFFAVDKPNQKKVMIAHCLTAKMVADHSTKPLQGNAFAIHRNTMRCVNKEVFQMHKEWCKSALQRHDMWDDSGDYLMILQISNVHVGTCVCIEK